MRFKSRRVRLLAAAVLLDPQDSQHQDNWKARNKPLKNVKQMHKMLT